MAMTEDDLEPEAAATKAVEDQIGDGAPLRMVGPGREKIEQSAPSVAPMNVVFTITLHRDSPAATVHVSGPAVGLDALAALSAFMDAIEDCKNTNFRSMGAWPPGLAAARDELHGMARLIALDLALLRGDGGAR